MIPQFSVCIPAYRNPATLEACLRTVLDQSGDDYEVMVSDDQGPPAFGHSSSDWPSPTASAISARPDGWGCGAILNTA